MISQKNSEPFVMDHTTILITLKCNLRCKLCSAFSPYYPDAKHPEKEFVFESVRRFFKIADRVKKFTICGGEPMIYPYLADVVDFMAQYMKQIDLLEILTNGTVVPSEQLIKSMKQFEKGTFRVLVDDYGPEKSKRVKEIDELLNSEGIDHTVRNYTEEDPHCGGWVYFGDLSVKKSTTMEDIEKTFSKCAYPQKLGFSFAIGPDGCMFPCGPSRRCYSLGVVNNYNEYIDLYDDSISEEQQREKMIGVLKGKSLDACAYCNGMCDDSPRYTPAQQFDRGFKV